MSDACSFSRRGFLAATIAAAALPLLSSVPWLARAADTLSRPGANVSVHLADLLASRTSAAVVGLAYLDVCPAERHPDFLLDLIAADLDIGGVPLQSLGPERIRALVGAQVQRDFALARTVEIDGWVLSRTEARLCALCALI
jgi:hypothetical protein